MQLNMVRIRVRVSESQWHIPTQQFTEYPVRKFTARHGKNPALFWPESLFRGDNGMGQSETRNLSRFTTRTRHLPCYCLSGNLARFERDRARLNLSLLKSYIKLNETFVGLYYERECSQNQQDKDNSISYESHLLEQKIYQRYKSNFI